MATFDRSDTQAKSIDIIAQELGIDKKLVTEHATLSDLGADSLDIVEIIMKMEEQFGIEIKDEDAENMKTVKDVVDYLNSHRTK